MNSNSLILTLLHLKGWGPKKIYEYVSSCSFDYDKCVSTLANALSDDEKISFVKELSNSKAILKKNSDLGISSCNILDKEFPSKLYFSSDKCVFLFYKGDISLLSKKSIVIIGTRRPDFDFFEKGKKITSYFAEKGYIIVSGLALGCDTIAHKYCLEAGGKTIAVLPTSCNEIQPRSNKKLAEEIVKSGGLLISEYSVGATFSKFNYPQRDRIQSLLSSVVIIIQASNDSGTMIAAKKSLRDGKLVYAIKGNNLTLITNYIDVNSPNDLNDVEKYIL